MKRIFVIVTLIASFICAYGQDPDYTEIVMSKNDTRTRSIVDMPEASIIYEVLRISFDASGMYTLYIEDSSLMEEYSLSASDVPLFVIFNNIPQRELKFRNNVFDNATCFSMPADNLFYENLRISQLLLYLSEDMYIEGVLAPFNGIKKDAYETFFTKKSLTSRVI